MPRSDAAQRDLARDAARRRVARDLVLRTSLMRLAEPGLAELVASCGEEATFPRRAVVYRAGEAASCFYAFVRGEVELRVEGIAPWVVDSRSGIGLPDVLADQPRSATATALTTVRAMRIAADDYFDFLDEHFDHVMSVMLGIADYVHEISLSLAPDGGFGGAASCPPAADGEAPGPLNLLQKLGALRDSGVFRRTNVQALVRLAALGREVHAEPGDIVFRRGETVGKFFFVARGVVEARRVSPEIVACFGPGELVCGYGALGEADDHYEARARSPVVALAFSEEDFFDVMEEHFELARSVLAGLATEYERLLVERERRDAR